MSDQLHKAHETINNFIGLDDSLVLESAELAKRLSGISAAILEIANSKNLVDQHKYGAYRQFTIDGYMTDFGELFIMDRHNGGVSIGASRPTANGQNITYDIYVPSESVVKKLIDTQPCLWNGNSICSRDYRKDPPEISYPFNNIQFSQGDSIRYFRIARDLSIKLMKASFTSQSM